jgi:hypothetical protein
VRRAWWVTSAVERAKKGYAAKVNASVEAARVARDAPTEETQGQRTIVAVFSGSVRWTAALLAAQILRFRTGN